MSSVPVSSSVASTTASDPLWTSGDVASATGGRAVAEFQAVAITLDSREIRGGELFVAIKGPQVDGHDYVAQALAAGASGALVDRVPDGVAADASLVIVPDVLKALGDLGKYARQRSTAQFIGITGSFGKTSTKEAVAHVLGKVAATVSTERSFNNHWGLPLTLARVHPRHRYAVIEMGMNGLGEISSYSHLTQPHVAVVTNTGNAHIGRLGSLEAIGRAKGEIFEGLIPGGVGIIGVQDGAYAVHAQLVQGEGRRLVTFGDSGDFQTTSSLSADGLRVTVRHDGSSVSVCLPTYSRHWAHNCSIVAAILKALELDWVALLPHLETLTFPQGRGNMIQTDSGMTILDESYNAAPTTMANALAALSEMGSVTGRRTIAILGDMLELADESKAYHQGLAKVPGFASLAKVYGCGPEMMVLKDVTPAAQQGQFALTPDDMIDAVVADARPGDIYLVKGSRGQWAQRGRMAAFVDALQTMKGKW